MNEEKDSYYFYPFETKIININDNISIYFQYFILSIRLLFNPNSDFSKENLLKITPNFEFKNRLDDQKNFISELNKLNQDLNLLREYKELNKPHFFKEFNKLVQKEGFKLDNFQNFTHKFITKKLNQNNIRIDWIKQVQFLKNDINSDNNETVQNELKFTQELDEPTIRNSKEEFVDFIEKKSKNKERMVLRERKKLSFIQFYMQRNYKTSDENTRMKKFKKVMDKNKDNVEEICVICLGIFIILIFLLKYFLKRENFENV